MPFIRETIVTTADRQGRVHFAPIGIIADGDGWVIAPFRPSTTLENLLAVPFAVANYTDDVRVFAGCLTGRADWPTRAGDKVPVPRLAGALAHAELAVVHRMDDPERPRFHCRVVHAAAHAAFQGFNRAQAAVIEAAILASRLDFLPRQRVEREIAYLESAVQKTAGAAELEAWHWIIDRIAAHYADR
jgi:uncharacterized protein